MRVQSIVNSIHKFDLHSLIVMIVISDLCFGLHWLGSRGVSIVQLMVANRGVLSLIFPLEYQIVPTVQSGPLQRGVKHDHDATSNW